MVGCRIWWPILKSNSSWCCCLHVNILSQWIWIIKLGNKDFISSVCVVFFFSNIEKKYTGDIEGNDEVTMFPHLQSWTELKKKVRIKTRKGHNCYHRWLRGRRREKGFNFSVYFVQEILGDPGAVSRAGRKSATKVFKHDWMSPWVPTLTETISKRLGKCWPLIGQKKCFVLSYPIGEQHLLSSFREFVQDHLVQDSYCLAKLVRLCWFGSVLVSWNQICSQLI